MWKLLRNVLTFTAKILTRILRLQKNTKEIFPDSPPCIHQCKELTSIEAGLFFFFLFLKIQNEGEKSAFNL